MIIPPYFDGISLRIIYSRNSLIFILRYVMAYKSDEVRKMAMRRLPRCYWLTK